MLLIRQGLKIRLFEGPLDSAAGGEKPWLEYWRKATG
jgi:hypothetical protein